MKHDELISREQAIDIISKHRIGKWVPSDSQCGIRCSACGVPVDDFVTVLII